MNGQKLYPHSCSSSENYTPVETALIRFHCKITFENMIPRTNRSCNGVFDINIRFYIFKPVTFASLPSRNVQQKCVAGIQLTNVETGFLLFTQSQRSGSPHCISPMSYTAVKHFMLINVLQNTNNDLWSRRQIENTNFSPRRQIKIYSDRQTVIKSNGLIRLIRNLVAVPGIRD